MVEGRRSDWAVTVVMGPEELGKVAVEVPV